MRVDQVRDGRVIPRVRQARYIDFTAMGDIRALVREATDRKPAYSKTPEEKAALYSGDPVPATLS